MTTRARLRSVTSAVLVLLSAACAPALASEGQLTWALHFNPAPTLYEPAETAGLITPFLFLYALHDALVKPMPGKTMAPSLAESWTASADGLVYDFVLRKGARFHHGEPVTADDVKFTFERYRGISAKALKEKVASVEAVDPGRVRFRLRQPWPDFLAFYGTPATGAAWIVPRTYVEKVGEDGFKKAPIGAGPYRFVSVTPGVELVLEAFDGYWRKAPSVKRLVFKGVPDASTRLAMLKRGEVDLAYAVTGELGEEVRRTPGLTLRPTPFVATHWLLFADQWDQASPWRDRRVRLAATHAVDRQAVNEAVTLGYSKITGSIIPASFDFYWPPPLLAHDPARARQLLAEAGYPNGFDAGDFWCDASAATYAEPILNYLQAAGIRTRLRPLERAVPQGLPGQEAQEHRLRPERDLRQRRHPDGAVRGLHRRVRLRGLSRHRRAVQGAGRRAGSEEARGDPAPHPAAHPREGHGLTDLAARPHPGPRPARGGVGARPHRRLPVVGALRGPATQVEVTRVPGA
jgi:peptide/nickel transport system substrate-binding protein